MTLTVSAREANQRFSDMLGRAARGEPVVITRRGKPVAQLSPYSTRSHGEDHGAAWDRLLAILDEGLPLGGKVFSRDEAHER